MQNEEYMKNAKGHLVPMDVVSDLDKARDQLVKELMGKSLDIHALLSDFKVSALQDIHAFVELSAERYGAKIGGQKGNITLSTYDGQYRVIVAIDERIAFDERLQAAKALVDECIREWTANSRVEIRALIDNAFSVDKQGKINTGRVLGLRRLKIDDHKWKQAMDALSDSITITESKEHVRFYRRNAKGEYDLISVDLVA